MCTYLNKERGGRNLRGSIQAHENKTLLLCSVIIVLAIIHFDRAEEQSLQRGIASVSSVMGTEEEANDILGSVPQFCNEVAGTAQQLQEKLQVDKSKTASENKKQVGKTKDKMLHIVHEEPATCSPAMSVR